MKTLSKILALFVTIIIYTSSCKQKHEAAPTQVSNEIISKIKALGYSTHDVRMFRGGYIVEGDIFLSEGDLSSNQSGPTIRVANTEQYNTSNLVSVPGPTRTITVSVSSTLASYYTAALDTVIRRYNDLDFGLEFQRVSSGGDIKIEGYYQNPGDYLAYAGFPSGGNPYPFVYMNTPYFPYSGPADLFWVASIMQHEIGHCIGLRHTDYMDLDFSCPFSGNELSDPSGAYHIWGTPSGPDSLSFMLACSFYTNRTFNTNDVHALRYIYPAPVVKAIRLFPWTVVNICTNDTTTVYSTDVSDYPAGTSVTWVALSGIKIIGSNTGHSVDVVYDPLTDSLGWTHTYLEAHISTPHGAVGLIRRFRLKRDCL